MPRLPFRPHRRSARRRPLRLAAAVVAVLVVAPLVPSGAGAQEGSVCAGVSVSATVSTATLPGGSWSTTASCIPPEAVYEVDVLGYRLIGGLGAVTTADGCCDRFAFISVKVGPDASLTLVGVEDTSSGAVTWAYSEGGYAEDGTTRTIGGAADAVTIAGPDVEPTPVAPGSFEVALSGAGTDLATAEGPVPDQLRAYIDQAVQLLTAD